MSFSTDLTLISLPFILYGGWGKEVIDLPFSIPVYIQYGIGIIGVSIFILSLAAWRSELKWEQENNGRK